MKHPAFPKAIRDEILQNHNFQCDNCGSTENLVMHHIVPLSQGGNHVASNISLLCESCHSVVHRFVKLHEMQHARSKPGGRPRRIEKLPQEYIEEVFSAVIECRISIPDGAKLLDFRGHLADVDEFQEFKLRHNIVKSRNNIACILSRKQMKRGDGLYEGREVGFAEFADGHIEKYFWHEKRKKPEPPKPTIQKYAFLPLAPTIHQRIKNKEPMSDIIEDILEKKFEAKDA